MAADARPERVVHLIHGTFARHGGWVQPGSALREAVGNDATQVRVHCWSGRNAQSARERAGEDFRLALLTAVAEHPHAQHMVIAHSHGGNVALYALQGADERLDRVRVLTLATPFLSLAAGSRIRWIHAAAFLLMLMAAPLFLSLPLLVEPATPEADGSDAAPPALFLPGLGLVLLLLWSAHRDHGPGGLWGALRGTTLDVRAPAVTARGPSTDRLLVVCAAGDEAGAMLGVSHLLAWVGHRAAVFLASLYLLAGWRRFWRAYLASFLGAIPLVVAVGLFFPNEDAAAVAFSVVYSLLFGLPVLLIALGNLPFGLDTLHWSLAGRMRAEATPEGSSYVVQVPAARADRMVHGVYENPAVLDLIGRAVRAPWPLD